MLEQEDNLLHKNVLFNLRKRKKEQSRYDKARQRVFVVSIILGLFIIGLIYFLSDISSIYRITVQGNKYLKDEDILKMSELSNDDKYLLILPLTVENRIKENPLINNCEVKRLDNRLVQINVEEKKAIAYMENKDGYELILQDNERIMLDKDSYLINYVPLISGFKDDEIILIENNLESCDYSIINEISEIRSYPDLKYQNVQLIMRDGNNIFTSVYGLKILNHYHNIQSSYVANRQICYYFEDISGNAYSSACPWEIKEEINEETNEEDYNEDDE